MGCRGTGALASGPLGEEVEHALFEDLVADREHVIASGNVERPASRQQGRKLLGNGARFEFQASHLLLEDARKLVNGITFADSALEAVSGADAVVLVTEWPEFLELGWEDVAEAMKGDLVVDGRNALDPERVRAAGLLYEGIGRR